MMLWLESLQYEGLFKGLTLGRFEPLLYTMQLVLFLWVAQGTPAEGQKGPPCTEIFTNGGHTLLCFTD